MSERRSKTPTAARVHLRRHAWLLALLLAPLNGCAAPPTAAMPYPGPAPEAFEAFEAIPAAMTVATPATQRGDPLPLGVDIDPRCANDDSSDLEAATESGEGEPASGEPSDWRFYVTPMAWIPGIKGTVTASGSKTRVDMTPGDFWSVFKDNFDRVIELHVEARNRGGWSLFGEVVNLKLQDDGSSTAVIPAKSLPDGLVIPKQRFEVDTDVTLRWTLAELGVGVDAGTVEEIDTQVDVIAGAKYWEVDVDADLNGVNVMPDDASWVDVFVGFRTTTKLADEWFVVLRGDAGGGGFGNSSRASYRAVFLLRYKPWEDFSIIAGWNYINTDWRDGDNAWDLALSGPNVSFTWEF